MRARLRPTVAAQAQVRNRKISLGLRARTYGGAIHSFVHPFILDVEILEVCATAVPIMDVWLDRE